jgi:class 3 adenylate cyclase
VLKCPSCGRHNPDEAWFCSACGASLAAEAPAPREERKVVTVLFADLVGFTARAERMDPEEVRSLLQPYHARLRLVLERHGGTVEKFIGDAVMALFGAPVAHEDDPERALRAGLAIRDGLAEDGQLEIRIGITTGEALVALGARPEVGEGVASGDVVNAAARLQAAAPVGGILVDETTYRATERAFDYRDATPVVAKGKVDPIPVWQAVGARSRVGGERPSGAPLVGRTQELTLLRDTLARVQREREPQLVTLVGVPGIGKSRLVLELFQEFERSAELTSWHYGRSLPYGEGVTFWALGEMVRAHAGILESDGPEQAEEKLRSAVAAVLPERADSIWVERHLRPLAGLETEDVGTGDRRNEAFAAWRRFLEALAEHRPLVLVLEDLHWADEALLDFVDHLVDWASGVPILVLATTRPELLTRRPGWGGGRVNSATIQLSPLSDEETAALVEVLVRRSELRPEAQAELLERAGGNPLYAEEFVRMLTVRPGRSALPESVHGLIAARLDALPQEEKDLLQDAAVVGRTFWLGALHGERWALEERLHALTRKEFVRPERRSSVAGEAEYVFRHALIREVAYEQIPKSQRVGKHLAAAAWIESLGRREDRAELLAHHYLQALAYGAGASTDELDQRAVQALQAAGDHALSLNAYAAGARFFEQALAMLPGEGGDGRTRCELLLSLGEAQARAGDRPQAKETFLAAAELAERTRSPDQLARAALGYGGRIVYDASRDDEYLAPLLEKALATLPDRDGSLRVRLLARLAAGPLRDWKGDRERGGSLGAQALEMARRLGEPATLAYGLLGYMSSRHSPDFVPEQAKLGEELIRTALEAGDKERAVEGYETHLASSLELGDPEAAYADLEAMKTIADELRQPAQEWLAASYRTLLALLEGRFAEAEVLVAETRSVGERAQGWSAGVTYVLQLYALRSEQGRLDEILELVRRSAVEHPTYPICRCALVSTLAKLGLDAEARAAFETLAADGVAGLPFDEEWTVSMCFLAETAVHLGDRERANTLYELLLPYAERVAVSYTEISTGPVSRFLGNLASMSARWDEAERHFERALQISERMGARPSVVHTQYDCGRMLLARGEPGDLERARDLLVSAEASARELGMGRAGRQRRGASNA